MFYQVIQVLNLSIYYFIVDTNTHALHTPKFDGSLVYQLQGKLVFNPLDSTDFDPVCGISP